MMQNSFGWPDGVVLLPVPLKHAAEVAQFAAAIAAGRSTTSASDTTEPGDEVVLIEGQGAWTRAMVDRLADAVTYDAVLALLDECSARTPQWVAKAEVEEAGGFSPIQLRNELGALSKKTTKLFGEATWPMEWKKERGTYSYRMDTVMAQWWTEARQRANR